MEYKIRNIKYKILFLVLFFGIFGMVGNSEAKILYVDVDGIKANSIPSDSYSRDQNSEVQPWVTPQRAWNQAIAGDTVYFREGIYVMTYMLDSGLAPTATAPWNGGSEGTANQPITFTKYPEDGEVIFQANFDRLDYSCMLYIGRDYITISYITFDCACTGLTHGSSRAIIVGSSGYSDISGAYAQSCTLDHLYIHDWSYGDNACAIDIGSGASSLSDNTHVTNCRLRGNLNGWWSVQQDSSEHTYCGIVVFNTPNYHIENNEISETVGGIILKHPYSGYSNTNSTCSYNWMHNQSLHYHSGNNYHESSIFVADNYVTLEHNVCGHGIAIGEEVGYVSGSGQCTGSHNIFNHNTAPYYGMTTINGLNTHDTVITNNILAYHTIYGGTNFTWHNNIYMSSTDGERDGSPLNLNGTDDIGHSLGLTPQAPHLAGGSYPPSYATPPSNIAGYALLSGAGIGAADDLTDMGADVSKVGIDAREEEEEDNTPPSAPSGLSVS